MNVGRLGNVNNNMGTAGKDSLGATLTRTVKRGINATLNDVLVSTLLECLMKWHGVPTANLRCQKLASHEVGCQLHFMIPIMYKIN